MMEGWYRDDPPANVTTLYIEQPLDHFDPLVSVAKEKRKFNFFVTIGCFTLFFFKSSFLRHLQAGSGCDDSR